MLTPTLASSIQKERKMATLMSLPTELLISILIYTPTTRALLHLSNTSRRLRSIWLEHSHHLVPTTYKRQGISHIDQAIALTLTEIDCGEVRSPLPITTTNNNNKNTNSNGPSSPEAKAKPNKTLLRLSLPLILRNAGLASSVLSTALKNSTLRKTSWHASNQPSKVLRAHYLMRHIVLAISHPHLRPPIIATLVSLSSTQHDANFRLSGLLQVDVSRKLKQSLGMCVINRNAGRSRVEREHHPDEWESKWVLVGRWRAVELVVDEAIRSFEAGGGESVSWDVPGRRGGFGDEWFEDDFEDDFVEDE